MNKAIRPILRNLRHRLDELYGRRLREVVLYGSHSRDQAVEGSDIDVLVVLEGPVNASDEVSRTIQDVSDLSLQHDVVLSCLFISADEFETGQSPLLLNIRREGVAL
jgi:predicted nucleotidyltransferase